MTKEQFVKECKALGRNYKDVLEEIGKTRRYLDRFKYPDEIPKSVKLPNKKSPKKEKKKEPEKQPKKKEGGAPGIEISNAEYHESDNLGVSKLKLILENAKMYEEQHIKGNRKTTDALIVGSLHHTLVLEPHRLNDEYLILPLPKRPLKSDYEDAVEKLGGDQSGTVNELKEQYEKLVSESKKMVAKKSNLELAEYTARKALESRFIVEHGSMVLMDTTLKMLLDYNKCYVERTFYGEIAGEKIQVRPDLLVNLSKEGEYWFVIDLKTAEDSTHETFSVSAAKHYFDIQEYVYTEILRQNGIIVRDFRFNVSGKKEGSGCEFYQLDKEDIEDAGKIVEKIIQKYKYSKENNEWREARFDYIKNRYDPVAHTKMPTWRKFKLIDMGVL